VLKRLELQNVRCGRSLRAGAGTVVLNGQKAGVMSNPRIVNRVSRRPGTET
jgi:hypothetical protein